MIHLNDLIIIGLLLAIPFVNFKWLHKNIWTKFVILFPGTIEQFDTILRKRWPRFNTSHLFLFSFTLTMLSILLFFVGAFLHLPTISLPLGILGGVTLPFILIYLLKPNIEASFLFEVRNIYMVLRTQIMAGARPKEAIELASEISEILKRDLQEVLLNWGGSIDPVLEKIAEKYETDELNILLSLIREMNTAGASNHREILEAFDHMKEMMEDEITAKEQMNDEKEMEFLEMSSFAYIFALIYLMVIPIVSDIASQFNQL